MERTIVECDRCQLTQEPLIQLTLGQGRRIDLCLACAEVILQRILDRSSAEACELFRQGVTDRARLPQLVNTVGVCVGGHAAAVAAEKPGEH